jgi:hypothetical protein
MKRIINYTLIILGMMTSSCENLESIYEDPNNAEHTHPKLLLKTIAYNTFTGQGTGAMFASRMFVNSDGASNEQYYTWDRGSFDRYNTLRNVTKMMKEAEIQQTPEYIYLGKFFRAYQFYELTRAFGDIPYSEALKGETEENFSPAYDPQETIIPALLAELKEAADGLASVSAIEGDIIYGGDPVKWQRLINSLRLRILLDLSHKEGEASLNIAGQFNGIYTGELLMESNADNGQLVYLDQSGSRYFEYLGKYGSVAMSSTFTDMLKERRDPRLFVFCQRHPNAVAAGLPVNDFNAYGGADPTLPYGEISEERNKGYVSMVNERYYDDPVNEPHMLMGYPELQFILAEAATRGWIEGGNPVKAQTFYENGVKASFAFYQSHAGNYAAYLGSSAVGQYLTGPLVNLAFAATTEKRIEYIITQKYIQFYFQSGQELFYNNRRTGYPAFATGGAVGNNGKVPLRWMYPLDEFNRNAANVEAAVDRQFGGDDNINGQMWLLK